MISSSLVNHTHLESNNNNMPSNDLVMASMAQVAPVSQSESTMLPVNISTGPIYNTAPDLSHYIDYSNGQQLASHSPVNGCTVSNNGTTINGTSVAYNSASNPSTTTPVTVSPANHTNANSHSAQNVHSTAEYLQQLLKDRARLAAFPGTFLHAERLLDVGKCSSYVNYCLPQLFPSACHHTLLIRSYSLLYLNQL